MTITDARATAEERLLVAGCRIWAPGAETFTAGAITRAASTTMWTGCGSVGRVESQDRSSNGGDDRLIGTRTFRIPAAVTGVQVGHRVDIPGLPTHVVTRLDDRPVATRVLQHLKVRESTDAPAVPA